MKPLLTLTLVLLFTFLSTAEVDAQNRRSSSDREVFRQLASIQMVESLSSPLAMVRSQTLKNAIVYSTLYPERVDLTVAVSNIAKLARQDASYANRRLAVAALRSIATYRANQYLSELDGMQDGEYRTLIAGVVSEYHETRPEGRM